MNFIYFNVALELRRLREIPSWFHLGYDFVHFNIS